ncbi:MAG: CPBP family intramembrane metalloprotease [Cyclobacteriaceae bacterium]|nr:CPBP family intramembrane metalloprotease [Cyclobacteriaceae bacterium]
MKKLVKIIREHLRSDFKPLYYSAIALLLITSISINYSINLENGVIDKHTGKWIRAVYYFILYATGYYGTCLLVSRFNRNSSYWQKRSFWLLSLFGLLVLSVDRGFPYLHDLVSFLDQKYNGYSWLFRTGNHAMGFVIVLVPLLIFNKTLDPSRSSLYGLTQAGTIKPYIYLLAMLAPIILLASFHPSFSNYYPIYKTTNVAELWGWPSYLPALIFEFLYGLDFLNVELLFRGFFVIGLAQVLGKDAILPMVTIYCYLHFGKPMGETISSVFGGYILGTIALYTRSVWGGVFVHVGVAWLMEAGAYFQKLI